MRITKNTESTTEEQIKIVEQELQQYFAIKKKENEKRAKAFASTETLKVIKI